jgi:hypothetical protein
MNITDHINYLRTINRVQQFCALDLESLEKAVTYFKPWREVKVWQSFDFVGNIVYILEVSA